MTYEETREQFLLALNSNAYLNMCTTDDMRNAIEALEKQILKKPLPIITDDNEYICVICPACEKVAVDIDKMKYCFNCGQAIDWSE